MRPSDANSGRRVPSRLCHRDGDASDAGFGIVEVIAAFTIVFVGFFALASATGSASRILTRGTQRQVATAEANGQLEDLRNLAFSTVALSSQPAHSPDESHPNYAVSGDGTTFDATHSSSPETLIVDTSAGQVAHLQSAVRVGSTTMDIFKYVTWVDDPNITGTQDYRRVTVIARYLDGGATARPRTVQVAALVTPGSITFTGGSSAVASSGSATPTPTSTPTGTPSGSCGGDTAPPTGGFTILSSTGAQTGFTASTTATLSLAPSDGCTPITYRLSNDGVSYGAWATYDPAQPTVSWTLTTGEGAKSVWAQYADGAANQATSGPQTITLDTIAPTVPGTLTRTASCSGNDRTVTLNWGVSTDTNWLGYRAYKSENGADYTLLGSVATLSISDTHSKSLTSVAFRVTGYDKAGNEGNPTNVITLAKNQCS